MLRKAAIVNKNKRNVGTFYTKYTERRDDMVKILQKNQIQYLTTGNQDFTLSTADIPARAPQHQPNEYAATEYSDLKHAPQPQARHATTIALKYAVRKGLHEAGVKNITLKDIEIRRAHNGTPYAVFPTSLSSQFPSLGISRVLVSASYDNTTALGSSSVVLNQGIHCTPARRQLLGIGADIISDSTIKKYISDFSLGEIKYLFTDQEQEELYSANNKFETDYMVAIKVAIKEAVFKSISGAFFFTEPIYNKKYIRASFLNIEVTGEGLREYKVSLTNELADMAYAVRITDIWAGTMFNKHNIIGLASSYGVS